MWVDIPVYQKPVHVHDVPGRQDDVQYFHERQLRIRVHRHYGVLEVDFHIRLFLIVVVIEYLIPGTGDVQVIG